VGGRHTLYKRQLTKKRRRWATETTFTTAFAASINPVFGKLGIYDLGREGLSAYAGKFFFNRPIPFDLPLEKSVVHLPDGDYGLAEVASGFNRKTLISPLHAALLAAVAANKGVMMRPRLVESVSDAGGNFLYRSRPRPLGRCVTAATARRLKALMRETVLKGTCRKAFRSLRRRKVFRNIELGAKTGTINDASDRFKYEWFTGYALPREASAGICVAVLGVHGEKLGIPSSELGREIIRHFMGRLREYARKAVPSNKGTPGS
jgi:cell division protein FtsI/penicillin-binding protein 2